MKICVIITSHNRSKQTINCIKKLMQGNSTTKFEFVIVDDASNDTTVEQLSNLNSLYNNIEIIHGNGKLFYSRGMRKGMLYVLQKTSNYDYILLVNDDVDFFENSITNLVEKSIVKKNAIIVGVTCSISEKELTYGGIKYKNSSIKYKTLGPQDSGICDTFNANCVLIPYHIFTSAPVIDEVYHHSLGDLDYGLSLKKLGYSIFTSDKYIGICNKNSAKNTWLDNNVSMIDRLKRKESPKGAPFKTWFYFLNKNFGLKTALIHGFTPYFRIFLKK